MDIKYSNGRFDYRNLEELSKGIIENNLEIKISENIDLYKESINLKGFKIPNRIASLPMEGGDASDTGGPSELTLNKYRKIAEGGAGLIWIEAVSVSEDGRSNDKQLFLTEDNYLEFKELNEMIKSAAKDKFGENNIPLTILQLNHSGRYCKKNGKSKPVIATHKELLDERLGIDKNYELVSDDYLNEVKFDFLKSARLAKLAGFDGVDIKACHGYLLSEILSGFERAGEYGGSFENRTKLMLNITDMIHKDDRCSGLLLASRLNIYDAIPYPQGWGVSMDNYKEYDLDEPKRLIGKLVDKGVSIFGLTMGNPYYIPHINKPSDVGTYVPDEEVIKSCERLIKGIGEIQKEFKDTLIVGVGYSWFRDLSIYVGAGSLENGLCKMVGFGRESIAYPNFASDILNKGKLDKKSVCLSCNKCSVMKSKIGTCGCVVRDSDRYLPMYMDMIKED